MRVIKLTKEEKDIVKNINILNEKRDYLQNHVFQSLVRNTKSKYVIAALHPRFGKNYLTKLFIQQLNKSFTGNHLIICPTTIIRDDFIKLFKSLDITNIIVKTYSGIFSNKFNRDDEFLSITYDEAHFGVSSNKAVLWSKCLLLKSRWKICLSGTFSHDNLQFLEKRGFDCMFELNIDDGVLIGTLPSFSVYNLGVDLTDKEKSKYSILYNKMQAILVPYRQLFPIGNSCEHAVSSITFGNHSVNIMGDIRTGTEWMKVLMKYTGWESGVLLGRKRNYNLYRIKIDEILETTEGKIDVINRVVTKYGKQKGIIFTTRQQTCNRLELINNNIVAYHADSNENAMMQFRDGSKSAIVSVNKISMGFTESGICYAINSNYNSTTHGYIQRISRALSLDESNKDKTPVIINLYCNNFTLNSQQIFTKDLITLVKSQKDTLVEWVDTIDQIHD